MARENRQMSHAEKTRPRLNQKKFLVLHSGVRKRHTRAKRMRSTMAYRAKFVQKIGGGDIVVRRNRPCRLLEEQFNKHFDEIAEKVEAGLLEVRTPTGELVDIHTLKVVQPRRASAPKPDPVKTEHMPVGRPIPATPEGTAQTEPIDPPKVTQPSIPEGEEPPSTKDDVVKMSESLGLTSEEKDELEKLEAEAAEQGSAEPKGDTEPIDPPKGKTESSKKSSKKKGKNK